MSITGTLVRVIILRSLLPNNKSSKPYSREAETNTNPASPLAAQLAASRSTPLLSLDALRT